MSGKVTTAQLKQFLVKTQLVPADAARDVECSLENHAKSTPRYHIVVRLLSFIGILFLALIALGVAGFMFNSLGIPKSMMGYASIIAGILLLGISWTMHRENTQNYSLFLHHSGLITLATAKTLIVIAVVLILHDRQLTSLNWTIAALTAVTWFTFDSFEDKFASLVVLISLIWFRPGSWLYMHVGPLNFIVMECVILGGLVYLAQWRNALRPVIFAILTCLVVQFFCSQVLYLFGIYPGYFRLTGQFFAPASTYPVLAIALSALIVHIAGGLQALKDPLVLLSIAGVGLLAWFTTPQILASLTLMVLGYFLYEYWITLVGGLLLPFSVYNFYYTLHVSLTQKSLILVESGVICLLAATVLFYISNKKNMVLT